MRSSPDLKIIIKSNLSFFLPYLIFIAAGAVLIVLNTKSETHLAFNTFHHPFFDVFFYTATYLGEGVIVALTFIILLTIQFRYALIMGLSNLLSALITQTLKHTLFSEVVRPKKFFEGIHDLYLVPGVDNHMFNSFPSGHTTCAFSLYLAIALIVKNKSYKVLCCVLAFMVGYSRIYLSQHFFEDVYAGSLIGVITTLVVFYYVQQSNKNWMDRSLISVFNK